MWIFLFPAGGQGVNACVITGPGIKMASFVGVPVVDKIGHI